MHLAVHLASLHFDVLRYSMVDLTSRVMHLPNYEMIHVANSIGHDLENWSEMPT
jgi:hypothetical protein